MKRGYYIIKIIINFTIYCIVVLVMSGFVTPSPSPSRSNSPDPLPVLPLPDNFEFYYDYFAALVDYSEQAWGGQKNLMDQPSPHIKSFDRQGMPQLNDIHKEMDNTDLNNSSTFYFYLTKEMRQETFMHTQYKYLRTLDLIKTQSHEGSRWNDIVKQAINNLEVVEQGELIDDADLNNLMRLGQGGEIEDRLQRVFKHIYKLGMVYRGNLQKRARQYSHDAALIFSGNVRTFGAWWTVTVSETFANEKEKREFVEGIERKIHDYLQGRRCFMVQTKSGNRKITEEYVFGVNFPKVVEYVNDFFIAYQNDFVDVKYSDVTKDETINQPVGHYATRKGAGAADKTLFSLVPDGGRRFPKGETINRKINSKLPAGGSSKPPAAGHGTKRKGLTQLLKLSKLRL